jgi:hypothetical protein
MKRLVGSAIASIALALSFTASAQSDDEICRILARNLQPDVLQQGSSEQQFSQLKQLVGDQRYDDWGKASSSSNSFSGKFSIPDEVDSAIGDDQHSNESNWELVVPNFCLCTFRTPAHHTEALRA